MFTKTHGTIYRFTGKPALLIRCGNLVLIESAIERIWVALAVEGHHGDGTIALYRTRLNSGCFDDRGMGIVPNVITQSSSIFGGLIHT